MRPLGHLVAIAGLSAVAIGASVKKSCECHCLPGDDGWPTDDEWATLNSTVGGRLVPTNPLATVCHDPNYDEEACSALREQWKKPETHFVTSSSVMQAYFANNSCDPFTDRSIPCELGNYVSYAVQVSKAEDVKAALKFSKAKNVRVVVRNTGHDYFGRSTGAGGLGIWMQQLKSIETLAWSSEGYSGPAMKVGAGVLGFEAIEAADKNGLALVTGECPSVGVAGGYIQGGGHSALSTAFGLAADQALEFEVVTTKGDLVKASPKENSDLFWALSGGGGGTYGIVMSVTVRAHPLGTVGGAGIQLGASYTTPEKFRKVVAEFHKMIPAMVDAGASVIYYTTAEALIVSPISVVNSTGEYIRDTVLEPFTSLLSNLSVPSSINYTTLSYRDHYDHWMGPLPYGHLEVEAYQFGSRLISRDVLENDYEAFNDVIHNMTSSGVLAVGSASKYEAPSGVSNAVLPAWRDTLIQMQLATVWNSTAWSKMLGDQQWITDELNPQLVDLTPGGGAYLNEADFNEPDWKETFFGSNYDKLLEIKKKWDPDYTLYTFKGVGSDEWDVDANGRMCKTSQSRRRS